MNDKVHTPPLASASEGTYLQPRSLLEHQERELALLLPLATQKCHILLQLAGRPWLDQTGESLDRLSSLANACLSHGDESAR